MAFRLIGEQLFDDNGEPLSGGLVEVKVAGTTTDKDSYPTADDADASTNANANPVVLDSAGRGQIWGQDGSVYKLIIKTSAGVTLDTIDDISGPNTQQLAIGYYVASGSANAQAITADPAWTAYTTGSVISFKPVADNTGAVTLNVNGLGAKSIKLIDGTDPYAGALDASGIHTVQYDGTNIILLNAAHGVGTFTPTAIGGSTAGVGTYTTQAGSYTRIGDLVFFNIALGWSAHTGTGALVIDGLPFAQQTTTAEAAVSVLYNGLVVTTGEQLTARVQSGTDMIQLVSSDPAGGTFASVVMDTSVSLILLSGAYKV